MRLSVVNSMSNFGWFGLNCPEDDPAYIDTITANTNPDYDNTGPDCYWEGKHWVRWYQKLKEKYGKEEADIMFSAAWQKRGPFGHELWIANNDMEFRNMVVAEGLNKTVTDLKIIQGTSQIVDTAGNVAGNVADIVESAATGAANTADAVSTVTQWLPWIAVGTLLLLGYLMYTKKSVNIT